MSSSTESGNVKECPIRSEVQSINLLHSVCHSVVKVETIPVNLLMITTEQTICRRRVMPQGRHGCHSRWPRPVYLLVMAPHTCNVNMLSWPGFFAYTNQRQQFSRFWAVQNSLLSMFTSSSSSSSSSSSDFHPSPAVRCGPLTPSRVKSFIKRFSESSFAS